MNSIERVFAAAILSMVFALSVAAQPAPEDSLPAPLNPAIELSAGEVSLSGTKIAWAGSFIPKTFFFSPGDDRLDTAYFDLVGAFTSRMVQNPDLFCEIRGYYSPEFEEIVSPREGGALAGRRAMAVREAILVKEPQLGQRVRIAAGGYDQTSSFCDSAGRFDPRVELVPTISGWNPRVVISSDRMPYWRRGFRVISDEYGEFLAGMLRRNPDLILYFSSGFLDLPPGEAADRISTVVKRFQKDMDWEDENRLAPVHGALSEPGEMIIDLGLKFCGPEPTAASILWREPALYEAPEPGASLSSDSLAEVYIHRLSFERFGRSLPLLYGRGKPPNYLPIDILAEDRPLLPAEYSFRLALRAEDGRLEISEPAELTVTADSSYYEMGVMPVVPFIPGSCEPGCRWSGALFPVVEGLLRFADMKGRVAVNVVGHAAEFEENSDSLALCRANYLWKRLGERLMVELGEDNLKELGERLNEDGISLEIRTEVHPGDVNTASLLPWAIPPLSKLPPEHAAAWAPMATVKWEYSFGK